jgi:prenyltransferase beta subunit
MQNGGVRDKPSKGPDPYHTCYGLAGNSIAQHKSDYVNLHAKTEHA